MNEEKNQELNTFNELFDININNNFEATAEESSQKDVRIRTAIKFLQYKKQHPNFSQQELEVKLIEVYGKKKALQVISDAENVKQVAAMEIVNNDKRALHKYLNRYSQIINMVIEFKQQHPDISDEEFDKKLRNNLIEKGYDADIVLDLINLKYGMINSEKKAEQEKAENQGFPRL